MTRSDTTTTTMTFQGYTLKVEELTISLDIDRVPYFQLTAVIADPGEVVRAALDPRRAPAPFLNFLVEHARTDSFGVSADSFPRMGMGKAWLQDVSYDMVTGKVTIRGASGEFLLDDKRRIAATTLDTGASTVYALAQYAVADVGQSLAVSSAGPPATAIPAGDRRLWLQGESASQLIEPELTAIDCRLWCDEVGIFQTSLRSSPPVPGLIGSKVMRAGPGGVILTAQESMSRDGDWYDGALIKYQYTNGAGAQVTEWHRSGTGVNTRGVLVQEPRPRPAANGADALRARTIKRGRSLTITATVDLYTFPSYPLQIGIGADLLSTAYVIQTVEWRIHDGEMTITAMSEG